MYIYIDTYTHTHIYISQLFSTKHQLTAKELMFLDCGAGEDS